MIIGLIGTKGSGKSTVASYLKREYGFTEYSYADKLKEIAMDLFDLDRSQVYGTQEQKEKIDERWGISPRFILQRLGTEVARSIHKDVWVEYIWREIHRNNNLNVVISDVRYHSEANRVKQEEGILIRIIRNDEIDLHTSETEQKEIKEDAFIVNKGTLADLYRHVDLLLGVYSK